MSKGNEISEALKEIRQKVAEKYGITYNPSDCAHEGDSHSYCDEFRHLQRQLEEKGITDVELSEEIERAIESLTPPDEPCNGEMPPSPWDLDDRFHHLSRRHWEPERKLFLECHVAGLEFHNANEVWDELEVGTELALVRDNDNYHDKKAVAIVLDSDYSGDPNDFDPDLILGYIPHTDNEQIATMLDMGWADSFEAEITAIDKSLPYDERMTIAVYIKRKEPLLRLIAFSDEEWRRFRSEVWNKGFCYFRWGLRDSFEIGVLEEGDKVVFLLQDEKTTKLCLMSVLAKGWNCRPYAENYCKLFAYDNCIPFTLTQIAGPTSISTDLVSYLAPFISEGTPGPQVSELASERLKRLFD